MRLKPEQLVASLQKNLGSVYLISGDEPLQIVELADSIRQATKQAGFLEREIFSTDTGFEWSEITTSSQSMSIFGDKKVIDLRVPTANFGNEGAKTLISYCEKLPADTVLLITCGKLNAAAMKTKWFEAVDKVGVTIQVKPLEGDELLQWLQNRLQQRGLNTDRAGLALLAERVEGNLLAAAQEIEKLYVLYGASILTKDQIFDVVADSSRYDVFKLIDAILAANVNRIFKVLAGLRNEGIAPPVVLWALMREARTLCKVHLELSSGKSKDMVFRNNQIWDKRVGLVDKALKRLSHNQLFEILTLSAKADRQAKGQESGDVWETILAVCLLFAP
ncbi:MAG: DNA polymerase III subunit delta [Methylococcaceae bacterium]|jgi:DNA polymerase-3 subunit delta